jgi:hypothetical protein
MCYLALPEGCYVQKSGGRILFLEQGGAGATPVHPLFSDPHIREVVCATPPQPKLSLNAVFLAWDTAIVPLPVLPKGTRPLFSLYDGTLHFLDEKTRTANPVLP